MKNLFTKVTLTLLTAGTLFATTGTALADTTTNTTPNQTSTTLVNKVNRDTNLATSSTTPS